MPRKQRIEYAGALYHVFSRGNYRKDLFTQEGSGEAFERAIFETASRCGWQLYAYVIMRNHYHLVIRTPEANLVAGMKWLQSTFATRFNRLHHKRGQVFQGRYKAIIVGEERALTGLVDYIHLNPVRAKIVDIEALPSYQPSSYAQYWKRKTPPPLDRSATLSLYGLPNNTGGMRQYEARLKLSEEANPRARAKLKKKYCSGWFIGNQSDKKKLAQTLIDTHSNAQSAGSEMKDLQQAQWETMVRRELRLAKKNIAAINTDPKGTDWKIAIAITLRKQTTASNGWIANRLHMGHPSRITNLLAKCRKK